VTQMRGGQHHTLALTQVIGTACNAVRLPDLERLAPLSYS